MNETLEPASTEAEETFEPFCRGTYSVEDNKIRLYPDGVRFDDHLGDEEYAKFKKLGFKWAGKQECFVCPRWTPQAEDYALGLCGELEDEDYSAEERAADRAERFEGYREKRFGEATGGADRFEAGPQVFGNQSRARAERQARKHDRFRRGAVSRWSKAEYWQQRTAGVIAHALYKADPAVRRSRILTLEAERREIISRYTPNSDPPKYFQDGDVLKVIVGAKGRGAYPVTVANLPAIQEAYRRWVEHYDNRIAYERAQLGEEGGSVTEAEIVPGGFINLLRNRTGCCLTDVNTGWQQVQKVTKSNVTGRVVSVVVWGTSSGYTRSSDYKEYATVPALVKVNVERLPENCYRAPTDEEKAAFDAAEKAAKVKAKATKPKAPALINPTDEDAQRLQALWNAASKLVWDEHHKDWSENIRPAFVPAQVIRIKQATYSASSGGSYSRVETVEVGEHGKAIKNSFYRKADKTPIAFKIRKGDAQGTPCFVSGLYSVVVLTDKPQKALPLDWEKIEACAPEAGDA